MDYYTGATAKARRALVVGGVMTGGASAPTWLATGSANQFLYTDGTNPAWLGLIYRRQGGDANNWQTAGATGYTPANPKIQCGVKEVTTNASGVGSATVTYPVAFTNRPVVLCVIGGDSGGSINVSFSDDSTTAMTVRVLKVDLGITTVQVNWMSVGI
jgi:hypothetical protein